MKNWARRLLWALCFLLATAWSGQPAHAETVAELYFPQTGHSIAGDFLTAYQSVEDPLLVYGYPITEAFQDPTTQRFVQYFERARFELRPENPDPLRIQLTPLGVYTYQPSKPLALPENFPACRTYTETGKQVCYAFLDFFDENGGVAQFGYPISNFEIQNQRIVQYFQRARLEWRPENPAGKRVVLADLGREYFNVLGEDPIRLLPRRSDNLIYPVLSLQVRAFTRQAVTQIEDEQTVYILVQDQRRLAVSNAEVTLHIQFPGGKEQWVIIPESTNAEGITRYAFTFKAPDYGQVKIQAVARYQNLQAETTTSFRIWW